MQQDHPNASLSTPRDELADEIRAAKARARDRLLRRIAQGKPVEPMLDGLADVSPSKPCVTTRVARLERAIDRMVGVR